MSFKPVIFLAFANDKVDNALYLRNLSAEMHGIRNALSEAVNKGLCDVVERSSASISDIVDVFQDPNLGPRISIFHYGGHANGFSLLLEKLDGKQELTHKDGLVPFLAKHENLKLVFLNGCSSEEQSKELVKAGIPCTIGTSTSINDGIATQLSIRFYNGISDGNSISKSWATATDEVKIANGTTELRALFWEGKKESIDRFPWVMEIKAGAEAIKDWNLPDISGNPLYGLPEIPPIFNLPETPFLYLSRYERKHAEIFFGRSYYIRSLYTAITDKNSPPILLFYGQSGVGKSSLLDAGLQPRLEQSHQIIYLRRNGTIGLSKTLFYAILKLNGFQPENEVNFTPAKNDTRFILENLKYLATSVKDTTKQEIDSLIHKITNQLKEVSDEQVQQTETPPASITEAWHRFESKSNKPLLIILDQVEEAYTRPNIHIDNEVGQLFSNLKPLFGSISNMPKGKIVLSFRKEYHPELDEFCKIHELPRGKFFIEHISKKDILEIFQGIQNTPKLKSRYNIKVEDGLAEVIAADLVSDQDAPIAPMLQILLTKLWKKATDNNASSPTFTHQVYHELKEEGLAMDEFLHNQLIQIKKKLPALFDIGFVYDVLGFYCTANSTSAAKSEKQLVEQFPFAVKESEEVLHTCKEMFLITDLGTTDNSAMLAHDTLAKSVVKTQQLSSLPLQQAKRVLNSRIEAVRAGSDMATLDIWDLKLLEKVQKFLPAYSEEIKKLMDSSRKEIKKKEREKRLLNIFKWAVVIISLVGSGVIAKQYFKSVKDNEDKKVNHMAAASVNVLGTDPTKALQYALIGMDIHKESSIPEIKKAMTHAYYRSKDHHLPWYTEIYKSDTSFTDLLYNIPANRMIPFASLPTLTILDFDGKPSGRMQVSANTDSVNDSQVFLNVDWTQDGNHIFGYTGGGKLQIHDKTGRLIQIVGEEKKDTKNEIIEVGIISYSISPLSNQFCIYTVNYSGINPKGIIRFYTIKGLLLDSITVSPDIKSITYNGDGTKLFITREAAENDPSPISQNPTNKFTSKQIEVIEINGKHIKLLDGNSDHLMFLYYLRAGKLISSFHHNQEIIIWNTDYKLIDKIVPPPSNTRGTEEQNQGYIQIGYHPSDSLIAYTYQEGSVILKNVYNKSSKELPHNQTTTFMEFSPNGKYLLIGSADNSAIIWNLKGQRAYTLLGHVNDVTGGFFLNENEVITTSLDGTIKKWDLTETDDHSLVGHTGPVTYLDIDSSGNFLVSCGFDQTLRIWDIAKRKETDRLMVPEDAKGIRYVTFVNEREVLAIGWAGQAFIYNLETRKRINFIGHTGPIEWAANIGDITITASKDSSIRFWNKNGVCIDTINPSNSELLSLDISPSDSLIAVGDGNGTIFLYNLFGKEIRRYKSHTDDVLYLDFSENGKLLVSASRDRSAIIWEVDSARPHAKLEKIICAPYNDCSFISANFSNNSQYVLTTSSDRTIRLWDINGNLKTSMVGHTDKIVDAFFAVNDSIIYSYSEDFTLRLWDLNGRELTTYTGHNGKINCAYLTNDLEHIFTASDDGLIRHWWTPAGVYKKLNAQSQFNKRSHILHVD